MADPDQTISLREEFRLKNFGFSNCKQERFYESQWCDNRIAFLVYRVLVFGYALGWIIGDLVSISQPLYWIFLTNWSEVTGCLYFLLALILTAYGYASRNSGNSHEELKWFHKIVWIVYTSAIAVALAADIVFWAILAPLINDTSVLRHPLNIHEHAINYVLLLIDIFVNKTPLRFWHFIFPTSYGLVYVIFTVILWGSGFRDAVYPVLNWEENPGIAALYAFLTALVLIPLLHFFINFPLYLLRRKIAYDCLRPAVNRKQQPIDDNVEMDVKQPEGTENNAFEP